jgi:hypothetical protein
MTTSTDRKPTTTMTGDQMMAVMNKHAVAELSGDFETVLETLAPNPRYSLNGRTFGGMESIKIWYRDVIGQFFHPDMFEMRRTIIGRENLVHEVVETLTYNGETVRVTGISIVDFEDDLIKRENYFLPPIFEQICSQYVDLNTLFDGTWL